MKDRFFLILLASLLSFLLFGMLPACSSVTYYGQAISGHLSLMLKREDIDKVLQDSSTSPELIRQLQLVEDILAFAETTLQLDADGSYRQIVISGQSAISWNVIAAEEFSVDPRLWCFPIAGCVPYRGYFKIKKAHEFAGNLESQGLDIIVSPALAYSTLGWFDDPLLDTMLQYSDVQLAAVLIHELAHKRLYIAGDTAFNEAFAEFVESTGVKLWLEHTGKVSVMNDWQERQTAQPEFDALLSSTREKLQTLYASGDSEQIMREKKVLVFAKLKTDYAALVKERWNGKDYFGGWLTGEINNARLALVESYAGGACAFGGLFIEAQQDISGFYLRSEKIAHWPDQQRNDWLQRPCSSFASVADL